MRNLILALLLATTLSFADYVDIEGGNISHANLSGSDLTQYWAGIVGWMDPSQLADPNFSISYQEAPNAEIYLNYPNWTTFPESMIVVSDRINQKPDLADIYSPVASDFNSTGMFSVFSVFSGLNFSSFPDSPLNTFANPLFSVPCQIGNITYDCTYIHLQDHSFLGVLKFDNGTHTEPIFVTNISTVLGFNGTYFDFQYMVPKEDNYTFYVYPDACNVTILSPTQSGTYTYVVPFQYNVSFSYGADSCWYVLDGHTVNLPDCSSPSSFNLPAGTHSVYLYARGNSGRICSDFVSFNVGTVVPPLPPLPSGPGGPHIGIPPTEEPPIVPPVIPPVYEYFSIAPDEIEIIINYPVKGEANFTLYSATPLEEVHCFVNADFAEYTSVELASEEIQRESQITGTIIVEMPPEEILDYDGSYQGSIQCVGKNLDGPSLMLSTSAMLHLTINEPWMEIEDEAIGLMAGETEFFTLTLTNVGNGTSYAYALSINIEGPQEGLFAVLTTPSPISVGESKEALLFISVPSDYEPGTYYIPIMIYENNRFVGGGMYDDGDLTGGGVLKLVVGYKAEGPACQFPLFLNIFGFSDMFLPWLFIFILSLANWRLIQWKKDLNQSRKVLLSAIPFLLSLPGIWILEPCFMMNVAMLQFLVFLYFWWKHESKKRREFEVSPEELAEEKELEEPPEHSRKKRTT